MPIFRVKGEKADARPQRPSKRHRDMSKMLVELSWDENNLGPLWMNPDNLKMLLFSDTKTKPELLEVRVLVHSEIELKNILGDK